MREVVVERYVAACARARGGESIKVGHSGWPDRVVVLPGQRCVWFETKAKGGRLSELQKSRLRQLTQLGAQVYVPYTKEQVDAAFEEIDKDEDDWK